jgi:glutamate-5-semialdehyde dehydrogenase
VHEKVLTTVWPKVAEALFAAGVKLLLDEPSLSALKSSSVSFSDSQVGVAEDSHYSMEHLSLTASVKTIPSLGQAITWINDHSSHHTDSIVTENDENASAFCRGVDSAGTYVNASTRFADGFRYGFGTEVGISTGRIHARGPVGLEGLVTYKYMMKSLGDKGHIASEFGTGKKQFKHEKIEASSVPFT